MSASAAEKPVSPRLDDALRELRESAAVWRDNDTEYRAAALSGKLPRPELVQFAEFVAELKRQVLEGCQAVRVLGGERYLDGFDCRLPENQKRAGSVAAAPAVPAKPEEQLTEAEEIVKLDNELRRIEADVDRLAREKTPQDAQSAGGAGAGGRNGAPGGTSAANAGGGRQGSGKTGEMAKAGAGASAAGGRSPVRVVGKRDPGAGPGEARVGEVAARPQGRVPTGDDDDVVAAQVREAAEKETDPDLKDKLWAEYRKLRAARN